MKKGEGRGGYGKRRGSEGGGKGGKREGENYTGTFSPLGALPLRHLETLRAN